MSNYITLLLVFLYVVYYTIIFCEIHVTVQDSFDVEIAFAIPSLNISHSYLYFIGEDGHFRLVSKESQDHHLNVEFS